MSSNSINITWITGVGPLNSRLGLRMANWS